MKKTLLYLILSSVLILLYLPSCSYDTFYTVPKDSSIVGYKPDAFFSTNLPTNIKFKDFPTIKMPTRVSTFDRYLLILDYGQGLHVFDNLNPKAPVEIAFMSVPASTDFALNSTGIVFNKNKDLEFYGFNDFKQILNKTAEIQILAIDKDKVYYPNYPIYKGVAFQCQDSGKVVIKWKLDTLKTVQCVR